MKKWQLFQLNILTVIYQFDLPRGDFLTLINAIEEFDAHRSNSLSLKSKIRFISELDSKINSEFLEIRGGEPFFGYDLTTPQQTVLKAPLEYSEIYSLYLNMKLDLINGEITRYNNSAMLFNRLFREMGNFINRKFKVAENKKIKVGDSYV